MAHSVVDTTVTDVKCAFPHIYVRSGYILGAIGCAYACRSPPRTKPRYAGLVPKGVTIPNADAGKNCSIDIAFYIIYI